MQTRFLDVPGGRLAYSDYSGDGQPVIMIPGMGALRSEYRRLAPYLRDAGYRSVTVDVRGHGESSVPWHDYRVDSVGRDIVAFAEYFDSGPVHLVGTSKSAGSVVCAAAERPELVESVVLIGPFVHNTRAGIMMRVMFWVLMHNPWKVASWLWYYRSLYPTAKPTDFGSYLDDLGTSMREKGRTDAAYRYGNASLEEADEGLSRLQVPALVVMGTKDPDFPDPHAEARRIVEETSGELLLVEGAGHYPQTEMPDETNTRISNFIERHSSREPQARKEPGALPAA